MATQQLEKENDRSDPPLTTTATDVGSDKKASALDSSKKKLNALLALKMYLENPVPGKNKQSILVRILRMWEARNFKQNGTLMSLDMLLLDEHETLIQASIYYKRIHLFKDQLVEGSMCLINDFEVLPSYSHYKVTDHELTIRFTDNTKIIGVAEDTGSIKREKFRIHSYSEFHSLAGTNIHLLDTVGQILSINGSHMDDLTCKQKIVLLLLLQDNSTIRLTLWDDQASEFRQQFLHADRSCAVIVATCMNPKMFAGKLHLNSTGSTKLYINYKLEVVKEFMKRMGLEAESAASKIVQEDTSKPALELFTIQQIFDYISSGVNKEKEVICFAKIMDINGHKGWKYLSCASCSKKLGKTETSLICNHCDTTTTIGVARFRVELSVQSDERTTTFVMFDRDVKKITQTTAEELTQNPKPEGDAGSDQKMMPNCILEMIGQRMAFQVKISDYNFRTSTQTFTVIRVITPEAYKEMVANHELIKAKQNIKKEDGDILPTFKTQEERDFENPEMRKPEDGAENLSEPAQKDAKKKRLR